VDRYGDDYLYAFAVTNTATSKATYRPNIKTAGKYHVDITYPKGQNRSTKCGVDDCLQERHVHHEDKSNRKRRTMDAHWQGVGF
jgi:hypothetical protein